MLSHPLLPSFSFLRSNNGKVSAGSPNPLGATWDGRGTNFALFSANATKIELCLFDREGKRETARPTLTPFPGFKELKPMVFAGLYPVEGSKYSELREALEKQAEAMPLWYLWPLAIFAAMATIGSFHWMVAGPSIAKHLLGLAGIALYASIMMQAIYGLTHRPKA